ncbi:glycosyltransferase [Nodosilinea nodulosa]|uniref:glycosyltransferase n=1 Tax=Nodosilinea nodulosa TaxID=416001 RepID=UPI0002F91C35|nr:glycosyltransferase [Nodosilinea nodulosa]
MKVLHVLPSLSYRLGGPTEAAINTVRSLRDLGIDTEIATTNDDESGLLDVPTGQRTDYDGVPVWFFPRLARLKAFMPSIGLTQWVMSNLGRYDILHTYYLFCYAPTVAARLAQFRHIPYVSSTIGQLTPWALQQSQRRKQIYSHLIERHTLNQAAAIHCTTATEAEDARRFGVSTPALVLPLGVNPAPAILNAAVRLRDRYSLPADCTVALFLSRLHEKKRPDFLLRAFAQLHPQSHGYHLLLAGSGEPGYCDRLQALAQTLGIADSVTFTGFVSGPAKDLLLQGVDLFALPSYSENFGIAIAEALAASLPVLITPDVQIAPDIRAAQAGLVVSDRLDDWTAALAKLLCSPNLRTQLGQNGQQLAKTTYSWPAIAQNLAQSYDEILTGQRLSFAYQPGERAGEPLMA